MKFLFFRAAHIVLLAACLWTPARADTEGVLVYRGDTFAQRTPAGAPLFRYERRVLTHASGLTATHTTRDPAGRVLIVESAQVSPDYETLRFEVTNRQSGFAGSVHISNGGRHLEYELNHNGKRSTASEKVSDPVVCGPSLFGFILKHWDPLLAGTTLPVRMLVLKEKTSYGFDLKFEKLTDGKAAFTITPSSFLVRMAITPLRVVFDASTRTPVRYEGRVPPMENIAGTHKDLDARVEYTPVSAVYR
ncbi:MAG: hypothetical protein V4627_20165 [Pseudomonadota bacterium]